MSQSEETHCRRTILKASKPQGRNRASRGVINSGLRYTIWAIGEM
jgi:hypothetical protein